LGNYVFENLTEISCQELATQAGGKGTKLQKNAAHLICFDVKINHMFAFASTYKVS
jgi:hypothetical protein